jgi:hypothetical protein
LEFGLRGILPSPFISDSMWPGFDVVPYHAHLLTDESVLQLQACLEQCEGFILLTTELPLCDRLRDYCLEMPVASKDHLLHRYNQEQHLHPRNVWTELFQKTLETWASVVLVIIPRKNRRGVRHRPSSVDPNVPTTEPRLDSHDHVLDGGHGPDAVALSRPPCASWMFSGELNR